MTITNNKFEPDNLEKSIRFGCSGLFGIFIAGCSLLRGYYFGSTLANIVFFIILAALFGYLAMRKGEKF